MDRVTVFTSNVTHYPTYTCPTPHNLCWFLHTCCLIPQVPVNGSSLSIGILSHAFGMEGYSLATGGIRVQVPENERDDARALIQSVESDEP